jgi:hypothetical protein
MIPDPLSRENFFRLGELLGWPHVAAGSLILGTELEWRFGVLGAPGLTPPERRAALKGLEPLLLASTEGARARLSAHEATNAPPLDPELAAAEIRAGLLFYGDPELLKPVVDAFRSTPPAVRDTLLDQVAVLATGRSTRGWTSSAKLADRDGEGRSRIIVLTGHRTDREVVRTMLHELAHCWTAPLPAEHSQAVTAQGREAVLALAHREGWGDRAADLIDRDELLAEALACCWETACTAS